MQLHVERATLHVNLAFFELCNVRRCYVRAKARGNWRAGLAPALAWHAHHGSGCRAMHRGRVDVKHLRGCRLSLLTGFFVKVVP